jgi:hypothetical protein
LEGHCLGFLSGLVLADRDPQDSVAKMLPDLCVSGHGGGEDGFSDPAHTPHGELARGGNGEGIGEGRKEPLTEGVDLVVSG